MAFGQHTLEMEVLVTEAFRNTVDCRCSSETLELWCRLTLLTGWVQHQARSQDLEKGGAILKE